MERSVFLARLIGPLFIALGVGMLANQVVYQAMIGEFVHSTALVYVSGLLSLLAGLAIVNTHNSRTSDWRVVITVLGWLLTIGGVVRIVVPQLAATIGSTFYEPRIAIVVVAVVALALGGFLSFKGCGR
ncbi:MAG: hypothetical protein ACRD3W_28895 [Terriglobales bacterium]